MAAFKREKHASICFARIVVVTRLKELSALCCATSNLVGSEHACNLSRFALICNQSVSLLLLCLQIIEISIKGYLTPMN